jgi:hypothetical protein
MASEGISISQGGVVTFVGEGYNAITQYAMPLAAVAVGGWVYLTYFRPRHTIVENRQKVNGIEGVGGKEVLLLAGLGLGALAVFGKPQKGGFCTGTRCRTPAGWAITDLKDVYFNLAPVVIARTGFLARLRTETQYVDAMRKAYVNGKQDRQENLNKYYAAAGKTSRQIFEEEIQAVFDFYSAATVDASTFANNNQQTPWYSLSRWL